MKLNNNKIKKSKMTNNMKNKKYNCKRKAKQSNNLINLLITQLIIRNSINWDQL